MAAMAVCALVATIASPLLECGKLVCGPIHRTATSLFKLQSNLNALEMEMEELAVLADEVKQEIEEAEKNGRGATRQARQWRRQAEEITAVAEEIMLEADQMQPANSNTRVSGCFFNCCFSRKVSKTLRVVQTLLAAETYPTQLVALNRPVQTVEHIPTTSIDDQTTASQNLAQIMDLLNRREVRIVGVWGMGGVGKTTLVKNLNNKLNHFGSAQPFGVVIWVTVSKDWDMKRVQIQIAERLNMKVVESIERMAIQLHERLQKEKKFLLILDDVWKPIDLDRLGIPQPNVHAGAKILLTSRSLRVCMQMKTDEQIKVKVLDDHESWSLFSTTVGKVAELKQIKPIAQEVSKQCSGLPLAIVIVGAAMRGKDMIQLWDDALSELQRSVPSVEGVEEEVFKPLKWSYDKLQGNIIKSCFLYCCLYPEDYEIEVSELVKCWVGEGFIDEQLNYGCSVNRGNALVQYLNDACLLESGKETGTVKMHDVVRDTAIWISSSMEVGCKPLVRAGIGLVEVSEAEFTADLKRISLMHNKICSLPPCETHRIECTNASTLLLQGNHSLTKVPNGFLQGFQAVKVLNLSRTNITSLLPVMQLADLRTLLLSGCKNLTELTSLGWEGLKRIQVFDLSHSGIKELPKGMELLITLRELYLFGTKDLERIAAGVFSMLSSLEVLEMERSKYTWGSKEGVEDGEAYLEELACLDKLQTLSIRLKRKITLCMTVDLTWISRLSRFRLFIGKKLTCPDTFDEVIRGMIIYGINVLEEERIEYLLRSTNATSLMLCDCDQELNQMLQSMALNTTTSFSALKSLTIMGSDSSFSTAEGCGAQMDILPNLEELYLCDLRRMKSISTLVGVLGLKFSKLRSLIVDRCGRMKYIVSVGGDDGLILEDLQEMKIWKCNELEEVFHCAAAGAGQGMGHIVPNLKIINLKHLPKLRTVFMSNEMEMWANLEQIDVIGCDLLKNLPLSGQNSMNSII